MGAMSPVSVAASLAQQVAEALAGHRARADDPPGLPVVFGSFLSNTDMQSGSPSFGTPESAIGLLCTGQIARHYGLPFRGGGALTSSQTVDAQAAYEAAMTLWPTFLAGTNFVMHSAGLARVGARVLLREVHRRRRVAADAPPRVPAAADQRGDAGVQRAQEVGQGGHFLGAVHTLERFRECFYRPLLSSTENYERWKRLGGRDAARARATRSRRRRSRSTSEPELDQGLKDELKAYVDRRRTELGD